MSDTFTYKQQEVINLNSGYNMVLAGPGCGKTRILAERVAQAYEKEGIDPSEMLCLTFTNRAAREMFNKIKTRLGSDEADLFVGNIHRYCSHFLFDNGVVSAETTVMDEEDTNEVLTSEVLESEIKSLIEYEIVPTRYRELVSLNWNIVNGLLKINMRSSGSTGLITPSNANKIISAVRLKVMDMQHLIYQIKGGHPYDDWYHKELLETLQFQTYYPSLQDFIDYCKKVKHNGSNYQLLSPVNKLVYLADKFASYKERNGLLDYDDLLIRTYDTYFNDKDNTYKRYKWIQIDEIQDLSNFQLALVDLFTNKDDNFVVVYLGDEQQAIYSFMGASIQTLDMLKRRCGSNIYRLDKNFRSPKYLLDLYNEYAVKELHIDRDFLPEPKDNASAGFLDVAIHDYDSLEDETERVYNAILPFITTEEHSKERTALLVPWNVDANEISDRLQQDKIPHFKISGIDSFQSVHMKTLIAHFNAVDNDFNFMAWSRILKQTYAVDTYAKARHLIEEMRAIAMCPSDLLRGDGITYLREFVETFDNQEIVLFDTETTGVDVFNDDIVQIAAIKIRNGMIVPGSDFNIFLHTDRQIPEKLGKKVNPMVEAYKVADKLDRAAGLTMFMTYIGDAVLIGHNVNFDYNILRFNLLRDCGNMFHNFSAVILDTLKLAHLICPRLRKYKLEYLIDYLKLEGNNSHMANDDILATFELAKYCRQEADKYLYPQYEFLIRNDVTKVVEELFNGYKECFDLTKGRLYNLLSNEDETALITEMRKDSVMLSEICEFRLVPSFEMILDFLKQDVISKENPNALKDQFSYHLMDMSTYREADMCSSSNFKENLFVSTVHKAKGLEFENVIVMRSVEGRYPHFAYITDEQKEESKRLFYVAISRAMQRLIVSGSSSASFTPYINNIIHRFTLRTVLSNNYFVEIGWNELRLYNSKGLIRQYKNISRIYESSNIRNQFELKKCLLAYGCHCDLPEILDGILNN